MKLPIPLLAACTLTVFSALLPLSAPAQDKAEPEIPAAPEAASAYSIIPADVPIAVAVRSYNHLKTEGDKLVKDAGIVVPMRPSGLLDMLFDTVKIRPGLDEDAPFALMLTEYQFDNDNFVFTIPFTDKTAMAGNFDRKPEDFEEGKPIELKSDNAFGFNSASVALRGNRFYVGGTAAVNKVLAMKSVEEKLSPDQRKLLPKADFVVHFAREGFGDVWKNEFLADFERAAAGDDGDARAKRLAAAVLPLAENFILGGFALRVDRGLAVQTLAIFNPVEEVQKALETIGGGSGSSHMTALPEGSIIAGFGASGDGRINGLLARDILSLLTDDFFGYQDGTASVDRGAFFGIFDEVWSSLRGSRAALYENPDPAKHGAYTTLAILDPEDLDGFLTRLQNLALFVNHAADQLDKDENAGVDESVIDELIENLAAPDFRLRAEATTRLALLGEDALPALKKAMGSKDPEVKMRAAALHGRLDNLTKQRGQDLIKGDVFASVRPRFIYFPDAEQRGGCQVDIIQFTFAANAADSKETLRGLFGPDWEKIRLVRKGKQVVLLAGSDLSLLDATLANLESGDAQLETSSALAPFRERSVPVRKAEFHLSMARILPMLAPEGFEFPDPPAPEADAGGKTLPLSSTGLSIQPSSLAIDWFMPPSEFGAYYNATTSGFGF